MTQIKWICSGHGCHYETKYFACIGKHGDKCIKKIKWLGRKGFLSEKMVKVNISYIKEQGFKQHK